MVFDAAERNGRSGGIQCQNSKESSSRGKRRVFLCRRTVGIKIINIVIRTSFLEILRKRDARWGERPEKEGWFVELVDGQNPRPEAPPRKKRAREEGAKKCQGRRNGEE